MAAVGNEHGRRPGEVVALILAAGPGLRLAAGEPKAFVPLAGRPMWLHSLEAIAAAGPITGVVLVVPPAQALRASDLLSRTALGSCVRSIVAGGGTRQESVRLGLQAVPSGTSIVVCHDAARPFASPALFRDVVSPLGAEGRSEAAERGYEHDASPGVPFVRDLHGVVPTISSPDTVKRVQGARVVETIPRSEVALAQTPQAFAAKALREAHAKAAEAGVEATDDAELLERAGFAVNVIGGEPANFKITSMDDLVRAEWVLAADARSR